MIIDNIFDATFDATRRSNNIILEGQCNNSSLECHLAVFRMANLVSLGYLCLNYEKK